VVQRLSPPPKASYGRTRRNETRSGGRGQRGDSRRGGAEKGFRILNRTRERNRETEEEEREIENTGASKDPAKEKETIDGANRNEITCTRSKAKGEVQVRKPGSAGWCETTANTREELWQKRGEASEKKKKGPLVAQPILLED